MTTAPAQTIPVTIVTGFLASGKTTLVARILGTEPGSAWADGVPRASTLVFIGRDLPRELFEQGLALCVEGSTGDPATVLRARV